MTFGEKVRHYRQAKDWTLEQVSKLTGLSVSTISMYEIGQRKTPLPVAKNALARVFKVKPEDLDDDKEE